MMTLTYSHFWRIALLLAILAGVYWAGADILLYMPDDYTEADVKDTIMLNIYMVVGLTCAYYTKGRNNRQILASFFILQGVSWAAVIYLTQVVWYYNLYMRTGVLAMAAGAVWLFYLYREPFLLWLTMGTRLHKTAFALVSAAVAYFSLSIVATDKGSALQTITFLLACVGLLTFYRYQIAEWLSSAVKPAIRRNARFTSLSMMMTQYSLAIFVLELFAMSYRLAYCWLFDLQATDVLSEVERNLGHFSSYQLFKTCLDIIVIHFLWRLIRHTLAEQRQGADYLTPKQIKAA